MDEISELLWDEHNIAHIANHSVLPAEVEQVVFLANPIIMEAPSEHRLGRLVVFGATTGDAPRLLAVFLDTPAGSRSYVVSARPMTARETRTYNALKEEQDDV